jgi:hypothetical protein
MKCFKIDYNLSDACGNTWVDKNILSKYYQAKSIKDVWVKLGRPTIAGYWYNRNYWEKYDNCINRYRTPEGKGYGIWEENPKFKFEEDMDKINGFYCGGFSGMQVREIEVEKL